MKGRSAIELMVLMFTATVCLGILLTGATIAFIEIRDPAVDTNGITQSLLSLVSAILGALLGLLAGDKMSKGSTPASPVEPEEPDPT